MENLSAAKLSYYAIVGAALFHPQMSDIKRIVAEHFGVPIIEMQSERRSRAVARPRQVAMYLCRELTLRSLPAIGSSFGNRDHTTVIHAIKRVEQLMADDPDFKAEVIRARQAVSLSAVAGIAD